ncbi:hypothetical protein [Mucilaginibacter psychrotolerans]|uniref:Uncharacterized protein n=1 Tax=Mucilaginibacter psychrotolerans TaxID=1524096 RepID=A0A4Y8SD74_9SPHI|nr:hypothetical protein [Mucilaginibacter psychrotolerans]TFF36888.1 hypothetical protein E2R66_14080 [Mucilaginibacter psychrotolerans]
MNYYLGGYYLLDLKAANFGSFNGQYIHTASTCINDSMLDGWSYSWAGGNNKADITKIMSTYNISAETISELQVWVDKNLEAGKIGWPNLFSDRETLETYQNKFFFGHDDLKIVPVYFNEIETVELIDNFTPQNGISGIGLYTNLLNRIPENSEQDEELIGYDLIGIEWSGDYHTFHCHDLLKVLDEQFNVKVNKFGLLEPLDNWEPLLNYMNDEENGFEPVPWFVVKMKIVK